MKLMEFPPITLRLPERPVAGIVLTSPHSGSRYSREFLESSRLDSLSIRGSEDAFVDELFEMAPDLGLPLLAAQFPRAWCDVNREPWELDPAMFTDHLPDYVNTTSPRVAAGLGTLARIVGAGEPIYTRKLSFQEAQARVEQCWLPFHEALAKLIDDNLARFGHCLVLDCHSMPTPLSRLGGRPDVVLGDGHGTSCLPAWSNHIAAGFGRLGFSVRRNDPYAGGFITRHYGNPHEGVQVMQIELARGLYMNERQFTRKPVFETLRQKLTRFLEGVIATEQSWGARGPGLAEAAE